MTKVPFKPTLLAGLIAAIGLPSQVQASGFRVPEISTVGTATANALVANTNELGALAYNPAGMAFHGQDSLVAGLTYLTYDLSVTQAGSKTDSDGKDSFVIPNFYYLAKGKGKISSGLAINSPFGLETSWPKDTFPLFAGSLDPLEPEQSTIEMVNINPNLSYQIDATSALAFGLDLYYLNKLVFNTQQISIDGRGSGLGWNLAYLKKHGKWSFGASYRSRVNVDINGKFDASAIGQPVTTAKTAVEFPDIFQAGVAFQATDKLGLEFDIDYTGWSSFDQFAITTPNGSNTLTTSTNNWDGAMAYRLGAIYRLSPATQLLFGYSLDQKAQPDEYFSARIPDADRQLFSLGVTHDFGNWTLEAAYMHVATDSRTINSSESYLLKALGGDTDPNGTDAYNGTYESSVNLFSVGLSMEF
ncbi:MAG TPA: hypothetical protein ENI93_00715 [Gammaproteobacteria bacterium]|nr:hypothetical protein [Gammaproteobacteria bacterium]